MSESEELDKPISGSSDDLDAKGSRLISSGARQRLRELKTNYPLTSLFDVNARDRASDDESLDLGSPFEDRVDTGSTNVSAGQNYYLGSVAPETKDSRRCTPTRTPLSPTMFRRILLSVTHTISQT
jgi:hypothetical protein